MRKRHNMTWRMNREELEGEHKDTERTLREGYSPGKAFREDTVIWSYNCQMANPTRLRAWSYEFRNSMVLMQGTQRQYDPAKGERTLCQWQTEHHDVVEARVRKKKQGGPQPEGVLIMIPKGMLKISRKILVPTNAELEGRGLMIWFSRGLYDLTLTTIYCPLGDRDVQNNRRTERLWQWVGRSRTLVPGRIRHIMGVDANGRVGSVRHYTTEDP